MRRLLALFTASLLALAMLGGAAQAGNHDHDHDTAEHPHVLLTHFEVIDDMDTPNPLDDVISFDKCIDLANNQKLPLQAHHHSLHTGTAGFGNPDVGITRAGHVVVPLQPYEDGLPFADCEEIEEFLFG